MTMPERPALKAAEEILQRVVEKTDGESIAETIAEIIERHMGEDSLDRAYLDVKRFHSAFNSESIQGPRLLSGEMKARRMDWLQEEVDELAEADTMVGQADAVADIVYFALGWLVDMGIPPTGIWRAVQHANMTKVEGINVRLSGKGKVTKPEGWQGPEDAIRAVIEGHTRR